MIMNQSERQALMDLINYNWADEEHDYYQQPSEDRDGHVFLALKTLRAYLKRTANDQTR
jgi:hypothetical protein